MLKEKSSRRHTESSKSSSKNTRGKTRSSDDHGRSHNSEDDRRKSSDYKKESCGGQRRSYNSNDNNECDTKAQQKMSPSHRAGQSRRPSIDDMAIHEQQKLARRKSNQSNSSSKSKDDLDVLRKQHRSSDVKKSSSSSSREFNGKISAESKKSSKSKDEGGARGKRLDESLKEKIPTKSSAKKDCNAEPDKSKGDRRESRRLERSKSGKMSSGSKGSALRRSLTDLGELLHEKKPNVKSNLENAETKTEKGGCGSSNNPKSHNDKSRGDNVKSRKKTSSKSKSIDKTNGRRPKQRTLSSWEEEEDKDELIENKDIRPELKRRSSWAGPQRPTLSRRASYASLNEPGDKSKRSSGSKRNVIAQSQSLKIPSSKSTKIDLRRVTSDPSLNEAVSKDFGSSKRHVPDSMAVTTVPLGKSFDQDNLESFMAGTKDGDADASANEDQHGDDEADKKFNRNYKRKRIRPKKNLRRSLHRLSNGLPDRSSSSRRRRSSSHTSDSSRRRRSSHNANEDMEEHHGNDEADKSDYKRRRIRPKKHVRRSLHRLSNGPPDRSSSPRRRRSSSLPSSSSRRSSHDANEDMEEHHGNDEADNNFNRDHKRRRIRPKKHVRRSLHRLSIGIPDSSSSSRRRRSSSHDPSSTPKRKSSGTSNTCRHDESSSSRGDTDSEFRSSTSLSNRRSESSSATNKSSRTRQSQSNKRSIPEEQYSEQKRTTCCQHIKRRTIRCLCCCTLLIFGSLAAVAALIVYREYDETGYFTLNTDREEISSAPSKRPSPLPSLSMIPTEAPLTMTPTPAPLADISIVVIVQLDAKPEETGFSLTSADNSTTYVSYSPGDLAGMQGEVVMEVVTIVERTELVFTVTDESEDGLCCTYGSGYYKILAGSGDEKMQIISGEQSAKYMFAAGEKKMALQIGGVDPNEYCKPCPDGKDCGRCAWCNADEGFLPDSVFHYQCKSQEPISIPKRCFVGEKRYKLHNQYISAMTGCSNGFEAGPQIHSFPDKTICVEEAHCVKTFAFVQPDCEAELTGSLLVKETCQDLIGGLPFGYSWGLNAPREKECQSSQSSRDFAASLGQRCCVDGVSFCSTFKSEDSGKVSLEFDNGTSSTPMPAPGTTYAPTLSHPPTWDGYPITVLLQLDKFPRETGLLITSVGKEITYFERIQGYYKKSQLVVEKVRIPLGIEVILSLTDKEGDGMQDRDGYIQVYSERGSIILDEEGIFSEVLSRNFIVGEPDTEPPTASVAPSMSMPPTFNQFPITIVLQLDQWSDETGFSIKTTDENEAFFDWPIGTFAKQSAGLVKETVYLPSDAEAELRVTDAGGDGFCCLYGDGYVKIFAGLDTEDESNLIAFESGDFDSGELSITFRAGPAPTVSPATTLTPTTPKTESEWTGLTRCDAFEMTLVLQLDKYSAETEWSIDSSDGLTNYFAREDGYYEEMKSEIVIETICLAEGYEYRFRIADFMGDGTCCWAGNGWYSLYEGKDIEDISTQVFYDDGEFGRERIHMFVAGKPITPAPTMSRSPSEAPSSSPSAAPTVSSMPTVTTYAVEVTIALDSNSHETGWHIANIDETVIIDRPPGYYAGNGTQSVVETIRLEAGDYTFTAFDTAGNGFCCDGGLGFYSLYSNGESLLFRQGMFEYSYSETFTIAPQESDTGTVAISKKSTPMLRGSDQYPNKPERQRQRKHVEQNAKRRLREGYN